VINPVPPLLVLSVPAKVTTPLVAELGVNPVVPALKLVTAMLEVEAQAGKPTDTVSTWPVEPIPSMAVVEAAD
jgi:hypothetical protein